MIRLSVPSIDENDLHAVCEVLASGHLVQGRQVAVFEERVADYAGVKHCVAISNCTSALLLSLLALGVGRDDKVAVTAYSWPATANVIVLCGAEPIFIDIDRHTFNMDAALLEDVLRSTRVQAILPVHAFGAMADMPAVNHVARQYGVPVIEDAACALGAELHGRRAGSWADVGCFSFHPRKAITTGEGGMIATDDARVARCVRMLRNHGLDPDASRPDFLLAGHNMRLTDFQAALGISQMTKLERIIAKRRELALRYEELLEQVGIPIQRHLANSRHVYQSLVALLPADVAHMRHSIIAALAEASIEATIGTYHMPLTRYFGERFRHAKGDFPATDDIAARSISLPLFEALTMDAQQEVVDTFARAIEGVRMAATPHDAS